MARQLRVEPHEALARIAQLYAIERAAKELTSDQRRNTRQEYSVPLLESIGEWLIVQRERTLPKSPIGRATAYALSNWSALCRYPDDGDLSIDNNISERALRAQAVGRKNWTFVGSDNGGRTAAILFSMIASCKNNQVDPFAYLVDIIDRLADNPKHLVDLLPKRWLQNHPKAQMQLNRRA